jgi:carboxyl-terminal processing protease
MKFNKKNILGVAAACVALVAFQPNTPDPEYPNKESLLMDVVVQSLEFNHYAPAKFNDELSEKVFDMYLERMDNGKRFFLKEDVDKFKEHRQKFDDYALKRDFDFFDQFHKTRDTRIQEAQAFYAEILAEPFDFEKEESFETSNDKIDYATTKEGLRNKWRKMLKYRVMLEVDTKLERQAKAEEKKDTSVTIKPLAELEEEAREKIKKQFDRWSKNINQEDREDKLAAYINTFANVLEPHTGYFPPLEKENFNIRISGKLEGIGAQLRQEEGYIKVMKIIPGSASWKQGELEVNDLIIKVAQGEEEAIDVVDMKMDDVLPMIRGVKGTEVRLTVKKTSGAIAVIPIVRDVVVLEESYAKSAIIEQAKTKNKVGLIHLPSFYADFKDPRGRRCSRDVKREVQKLIAEGVDGIVIDLRFNGGGSLRDVVDMSGLFIETGPIVQVKGRNGRPHPLEDRDPSVLYDGPLVILVNPFSASASEIMAAALQDYGRAVIVGTAPSTFGKGTVQRFFNLDAAVPARFKDYGELGAMKITIQKFFRVNGGSTQLKGVIPDIVLPGNYSYQKTGEKEEEYPMKWTEIEPVFYQKGEIKKMDKVKKKSQKRVAANPTFALIDERAKWMKEMRDNSTYSLNLNSFREQQSDIEKTTEKYKDIGKDNDFLQISILAADKSTIEADTVRKASIENWHKNLKKDPYIQEAFCIVGDLQ